MKNCLNLIFKNFRSILYKLDMFGSPINLQIKKENEYHTFFGVIMSIGIVAFIYYSFLSLIIDMLNRSEPNVLQNLSYQANPQEYILQPDQFIFYLLLTDIHGVPILQKQGSLIYQATVEQCYRTTNENNNVSSICNSFQLKNCASLQLNSNIQNKLNISQAVLASAVCLDPEDWKKFQFSLQGTPQTPNFKTLQFNITKCSNFSNFGGCASPQEIDRKLAFAYAGFFLSDNVLNQQQQGNPFTMVSKLITTTISETYFKSMTLLMRKSIFYNTENFFYYFGNTKQYTSLFFDSKTEQVFNTKSDLLLSTVMYLDDREALYYRTYSNILDILGNVGGLMQLIVTFLGFIVKPINKLSCDLFLAQEIFNFEKNNISQVHPKNESQMIFSLDGKGESDLIKFKKYFKLKASKIQLFVHQFFCSQKSDRDQISFSIDSIYKKLDILTVIEKMIEIDKLKKLLLTDDQQILFNYIRKPKIVLGNPSNLKSSFFSNCYNTNPLTFEQEIMQAFNSYCSIKESDDHTSRIFNKKLIELLDRDIKQIFDKNCQVKQTQQLLFQSHQSNSINDLSLVDPRIRQSNLIHEIESIINI